MPILEACKQPELVNSPDNFTPDGRWILGESAEVKNYFVACGMNGNSLQVSENRSTKEKKISFQNVTDLFVKKIEKFIHKNFYNNL